MNITELQETLQNLNISLTAREIAKIWEMDETSFSRKKKESSQIKHKNIMQLEKKLGINLAKKANTITIKYYPEAFASCGNGTFEISKDYIKYQLPATFFPNHSNKKTYSMCHAHGNSMFPLILDGDFIICEHARDLKIQNGEMYIFHYDDQIYLKRLTKNINQIVVESENPDFPTQYINDDKMNEVHLIGHVICNGRMSRLKENFL